jgi:hypothetical protein
VKPRQIFSAVLILACGFATVLRAQTPDDPSQYTADQLDQLVAPIALYPDVLVAIILPASTYPADIQAASQYFAASGDPNQVDNQPWDESVKALAHYPAIVQWMGENLDWTQALGQAYAAVPQEVMQSIQQVRAQARANGTLTDTPEQTTELDGDNILIEPTNPNGICVPYYNPQYIWYNGPVVAGSPWMTFGPLLPIGPWLYFELDWDDFVVWRGTWHGDWAYHRDWRGVPGRPVVGTAWRVDPVRARELTRNFARPALAVPQTRPIVGTPDRPAIVEEGQRPNVAPSPVRDYTGWRGAPGVPAPSRPAPGLPERPAVVSVPNRPAPAAPSGPLFGGYDRGTTVRDYSARGEQSRQAAGVAPRAAAAESRAAPEPARSAPSGPTPSGSSDGRQRR